MNLNDAAARIRMEASVVKVEIKDSNKCSWCSSKGTGGACYCTEPGCEMDDCPRKVFEYWRTVPVPKFKADDNEE
jgi:hypothetical protein